MVSPGITDEDRERSARRLKLWFVLLVAASGGIVGFQAEATPAQLAAIVGAGLVVGWLLVWFVARNLRKLQPEGLDQRLQ